MRYNYTFLLIMVLFSVCGNALSQTETAPWGDGSPEDPFKIESLGNLYWLTRQPLSWDKHYIQTADIDASSTAGWNDNKGWSPLGNESVTFTGSYDGQGHIIENLYINRPAENYQGFFGLTNGSYSSNAIIKNLGIVDANITGNSMVGGLIGRINQYCLIENCFSTGVVNASGAYSGGLIGENYGNSKIKNSYSRCNVISTSHNVGGLIGVNGNGNEVINCYSTGSVSGSSSVGGLMGNTGSAVINSFWDIGTSGQDESGGGTGKTTSEMKSIATFTDLTTAGLNNAWDFRGYPNDDTGSADLWDIEGSLNDGYPFLNWQYASLPSVRMTDIESIGPSTAIINAEVTNDGGAEITQRGVCWNTTVEPLITDDKTEDGTGTGVFISELGGLAENTVYYLRAYATNSAGTVYGNEITIKTNLSGGLGTENDPYLISTLEDLVWLMANKSEWDKHYRQTANIDASASSEWFGKRGFSPVGTNPNTTTWFPFMGKYDGYGNRVENLFINRPEQNHIALFGVINQATIENLGVTGANITGNSFTAALIGRATYSSVTNCYTTGSVSGLTAGGLVNYTDDVTIVSCYSECDVSGYNAGGLVNDNRGYSVIDDCYFAGNVSGRESVGGLVGYNRGVVRNSYSMGTVTAVFNNAGGLIGYMDGGSVYYSYSHSAVSGQDYTGGLIGNSGSNAVIERCFSTGAVNGNNYTGGLAGVLGMNSSAVNCYSTGSVNGNGNVGGLFGITNIDSQVNYCYSTGGVTATFNFGGLVGSNNGAVSNSFWDTQTSGRPLSAGGTGKSTLEMQDVATYTNLETAGLDTAWDFLDNPGDDVENNEYWNINESVNGGYPHHTWMFLPSVETASISDITTASAVSGGSVTGDAGYQVTERGLLWGTELPPLMSGNKLVDDEAGQGEFISEITGLDPGVAYYVRAYATNGNGTMYGQVESFSTEKLSQTITFDEIPEKSWGDEDFELTATASSGLGIFYESSNTAVATIAGSTVIITGVGSTTITASQPGNDSYYAAESRERSLVVGKAMLTVTAGDKSKTYGDPNPELTFSYSGFVNDEDESVLNEEPVLATTAGTYTGAGEYEITVSGGTSGHYSFNYVNGTLTIEKAMLTATAQNNWRTYGWANPVFYIVYSGFIDGDSHFGIDVLPVASTVADERSDAGQYDITVSGGSDNNYTFDYVSGTLTVEKAPLNATADDQSRYYGYPDPQFTISYSGLLNDDDGSVIDEEPEVSVVTDEYSIPGSYVITISGGSDNNYYFIMHYNGIFTIEKAPLTVTADDILRDYGDPNPELTLTYEGFVLGQGLGDLNELPWVYTVAELYSEAGEYEIVVNGAYDQNYEIIPVNGTLTVNPPTGIEEPVETGLRVYPNPVSSVLYVELPDGSDRRFSVTDVLGSLVLTGFVENNSINFSHLKSGLYLLNINTRTIRIIKK